MPRTRYPTEGDLRAALVAAGITPTTALEGQLLAMAPAGVAAFEKRVRRRMLAGAATAVLYAPPTNHEGVLFIQDLASVDETGAPLVPTVTYTPLGSSVTTYASGTDFLLEPVEASGRGHPFTRIRFRRHDWRAPVSWTLQHAISITGRHGAYSLLPDDAWLGMCYLGAAQAMGVSLFALRGGLKSWGQAGVQESFAEKIPEWASAVEAAVSAYRRVDL